MFESKDSSHVDKEERTRKKKKKRNKEREEKERKEKKGEEKKDENHNNNKEDFLQRPYTAQQGSKGRFTITLTHTHTQTNRQTHTHTHTHAHTHASDEGIGTTVRKSLEIIKQVRLEGGFKRGGRIRVAECLRQIVPSVDLSLASEGIDLFVDLWEA